ncbi:MAG: uracil-DNA glycosylase [Planctomycetota bacterium]
MTQPDQLARIAAQHASTARLLGAESVPVRRQTGSAAVEPKPAPRVSRDRDAVAADLDALRAKYESDAPHQHFNTTFENIVWGDGDPCARLMFVGEAPGAEEDKTGTPFVGRAGELLNKMIKAMGLSRDTVYIANVLKTRPPGNATPTLEEMRLCAPYLYEQIRIVHPEAIVTLGKPAVHCLLERSEPMGKLRGQWFEFPPPDGLSPPEGFQATIPVMPTYHPAYLLRSYTEENRKLVWSDLQQVMTRLGL